MWEAMEIKSLIVSLRSLPRQDRSGPDQQDGLVAQFGKFLEFAKKNGMTEMETVAGRVDAEVEADLSLLKEFLQRLSVGIDLLNPPRKEFFKRYHFDKFYQILC